MNEHMTKVIHHNEPMIKNNLIKISIYEIMLISTQFIIKNVISISPGIIFSAAPTE